MNEEIAALILVSVKLRPCQYLNNGDGGIISYEDYSKLLRGIADALSDCQAVNDVRVKVLISALEKYAAMDAKFHIQGGVFDPKLGCTPMKEIGVWNLSDIAKEALKEFGQKIYTL